MSRQHIHAHTNIGDKIADQVAATVGSWRFIIIQSTLLLIWLILNITGIVFRWDPYPFILLNLALSFQAACAGPVVMMSQNRQAARDRKRDDLESVEVDGMYQNHQLLLTLNQQQLEILQLLKPETREVRRDR